MRDQVYEKMTSKGTHYPRVRRLLRFKQKHHSIVEYGVLLEVTVPGEPHEERWS